MAKKKDDDDKVFDVAKPGSLDPDTGSKPMVVGHKSGVIDDTVKEPDSHEESDGEKVDTTTDTDTPAKKKTIVPISDSADDSTKETSANPSDESTDKDSADEDNGDTKDSVTEKKTEEPAVIDNKKTVLDKLEDNDTKPSGDEKSEPDESDEADEKKDEEKSASDEAAEREERLQEIIKTKEYVVPIHESQGSALKSFMTVMLGVVLIGVVLGAILIDAEVIDAGITLPFDFL